MGGAEILRFYEELGPAVFPRKRLLGRVGRVAFAKYRQEPLRAALEQTFGDRRLGESTKRLVIPALNLETGEVHVYKTAHHPKLEIDYKVPVVDVAIATSAAPTYFPAHRTAAGIPLIDGGMWANNPTGLAVVEAIGILNWPREHLRVLSLGCVTEPPPTGLARASAFGRGRGFAGWGLRITDVFMTAQSYASLGTAYVLVGHENVLRISPHVGRGRFSLDGVKEIEAMRGLGAVEARRGLPRVRELFCGEHAEPFLPYRQPHGA